MKAFIHSPDIERYHYPPECPFKTERAGMTRSLLVSMNSLTNSDCKEVAPVPATEKELEFFHTRAYLSVLKRVSAGTIKSDDLFLGLGTDETPIFRDLYLYAALAAGATLAGAKLIANGKADLAFNPSGGYHHAYPEKAGGFCYINDIVLGCMVLKKAGMKVLCLDLDAHQGNGTQFAFYQDPSVFTISLHETGKTLYPWIGFEEEIGDGKGKGFNANLPFPAGTDDDTYCWAFNEIVLPLISAYNPDAIVLELGMDVLAGDPLTHLRLTNNAFADLLPDILRFGKPMLVTGGGGYHAENTARAWALLWRILCGMESGTDEQMGMGGVFLGSSEWASGLRDMRLYSQPEEREKLFASVKESVAKLKSVLFPLHHI